MGAFGEQAMSDRDAPDTEPAGQPARFHSILFPASHSAETSESDEAPAFFHDLNLDKVVEAVTDGWAEYGLSPLFYTPPGDLRTVAYRQGVMKDLEQQALMDAVQAFCSRMRQMRDILPDPDGSYYSHEKERRILDAAAVYCRTVSELSEHLCSLNLASHGMRAFRSYLANYVRSPRYQLLASETESLLSRLSSIHYCLVIKNSDVTVRSYDSEEDYSAVVERVFAKFRQPGAKDYRARNTDLAGMNHIQALVVDQLARLYPEVFGAMADFSVKWADYPDEAISRFDREVHFYVAYLTHAARLRQAGLSFCYPRLSRVSKEIEVRDSFDLALAAELLKAGTTVVTNDVFLRGPERVLVVSGPNQGGKTTFARMFGQLHYLARLGCPIPGTEARLFFFDRIFTHFEKEEDIETLRGKLADDLVRIREILDQATTNSIVIMNEIFSSTTLKDALYLGKQVLTRLCDLDALGVCVTFLEELASMNDKTVSVVSTVDPADPSVRTYKLVRKPADGLAYALAIARKHRVTYDWLRRRLAP